MPAAPARQDLPLSRRKARGRPGGLLRHAHSAVATPSGLGARSAQGRRSAAESSRQAGHGGELTRALVATARRKTAAEPSPRWRGESLGSKNAPPARRARTRDRCDDQHGGDLPQCLPTTRPRALEASDPARQPELRLVGFGTTITRAGGRGAQGGRAYGAAGEVDRARAGQARASQRYDRVRGVATKVRDGGQEIWRAPSTGTADRLAVLAAAGWLRRQIGNPTGVSRATLQRILPYPNPRCSNTVDGTVAWLEVAACGVVTARPVVAWQPGRGCQAGGELACT